jgi:hypothetical protein
MKTYSLRFSTEKWKTIKASVCTMTSRVNSRKDMWKFITYTSDKGQCSPWSSYCLMKQSVSQNFKESVSRIQKRGSVILSLKSYFIFGNFTALILATTLRLCMKFQFLEAVNSKMKVLWDMRSCFWHSKIALCHVLKDLYFKFL